MDIGRLLLFLVFALFAEILGTLGGFGSSMFFVPLANIYIDFKSVLGVTALFHLSSNISKITLFRKGIDKKVVLGIGIPAVLFVILGAALTESFDKRLLSMFLSLFLIISSVFLLIRQNFSFKPTIKNSIIGGASSGFFAGLLGTGGAIRGLTMAAFNLDKEAFIATSAIIDLAVDLSRTVVYFKNGYIHKHDMYLIPFLFAIGFAGTLIGKKLLTRIDQKRFRTIVLVLIMLIGVFSFVKAV